MLNRIKTSEISQFIENKTPFITSNGTSQAYFNNKGEFCVFSYNTLILQLSPNNDILKFENSYFSTTTSKLQNIIKKIFSIKEKKWTTN